MLPGQLGTGRSVSLTVTENVQLELLPDASVAVHTTLVVPFGKLNPDTGTHTIEPPTQLSVNVARKLTLLLHCPGAALTVMLPGQLGTGRSVSLTVTEKLQLELLLQKLSMQKSSIKKIALPTMEGLEMVEIDAIISCSSDGNYTNFFLKGNKKLIASRTLKDVEELLSDYSFVRVHNSFLVNINEIHKYFRGEGGYLVMSDGTNIDVSRTRKEMLLQKLRPNRL